jgi:hypothetical protein
LTGSITTDCAASNGYSASYQCSGNTIQRFYNDYGCSAASCVNNGYWINQVTCSGNEFSLCINGYSSCQNKCWDTVDNDGDATTDGDDSDCRYPITYSSSTNNADLYSVVSSLLSIYSGFDVTINSGVTIGSSSTGTYAFVVSSSFPAATKITITNNGYIVGKGGNGGYWISLGGSVSSAENGGPAFIAQRAVTMYNYGTIGGGGGGGGRSWYANPYGSLGGGGGAGYPGGTAGWTWAYGNYWGYMANYNVDGTLTTGSQAYWLSPIGNSGGGTAYGGGGGGLGAGGTSAGDGYLQSGYPTYSWDLFFVSPVETTSGGAAVAGNAYINWGATGTRYGSIG